MLARYRNVRSGHALLGELEPWEWNYWQASFQLDPAFQDWEIGSMIAANLWNVAASMAPRPEGEEAPPEMPLDAFVPYRKHESTEIDDAVEGLNSLRGLG